MSTLLLSKQVEYLINMFSFTFLHISVEILIISSSMLSLSFSSECELEKLRHLTWILETSCNNCITFQRRTGVLRNMQKIQIHESANLILLDFYGQCFRIASMSFNLASVRTLLFLGRFFFNEPVCSITKTRLYSQNTCAWKSPSL